MELKSFPPWGIEGTGLRLGVEKGCQTLKGIHVDAPLLRG